jgi:hypothetical protein
MRREMVEGKTVHGCESCYVREAVGAQSMRQTCNAVVGPERIRRFIEQSIASDFQVAPMPESVEVVVGNRCNLKCRMCRSSSSSLIAKDRVHVRWNYQEYLPVEAEAVLALLDERLFRDPAHLRRVHFIGGEPFVINEIEKTLQLLIDRGVAGRITLSMNTNGTRVSPRWMKLTESFEKLHLSISIDGVGDTFEYIRFPAPMERSRAQPRRLPRHAARRARRQRDRAELQRARDHGAVSLPRSRRLDGLARAHRPGRSAPPRDDHAARSAPPRSGAAARLCGRLTAGPRTVRRCAASSKSSSRLAKGSTPSCCASSCCSPTISIARAGRASQRLPDLLALIEATGFVWSDEVMYASADAGVAAVVETA